MNNALVSDESIMILQESNRLQNKIETGQIELKHRGMKSNRIPLQLGMQHKAAFGLIRTIHPGDGLFSSAYADSCFFCPGGDALLKTSKRHEYFPRQSIVKQKLFYE